jgi:hypothetical protein
MRASRYVATIGKQVLKLNHNLMSIEVYNQTINLAYKEANNAMMTVIRVMSLSPFRCRGKRVGHVTTRLVAPYYRKSELPGSVDR